MRVSKAPAVLASVLFASSTLSSCARMNNFLDRRQATPAETAAIANVESAESGAPPAVCTEWLSYDLDPGNLAIPLDTRRFLVGNNVARESYCNAGLR